MLDLRYYQQEAREAVWASLCTRKTENPCVVLPTGSGKTPLLAALCQDAVEKHRGKVMIISHVKELLEQSAETIRRWYPGADVGVYSAGLRRRDYTNTIVIGGIQSIADKAFHFGERHLVFIDEAHLIPPEGDGRYRTFLDDLRTANPRLRIVGLTATPYRTGSGKLCGPDEILNHVAYKAEIGDLVKQGFLSPLKTKSGVSPDLSQVERRQGEFVANQMAAAFDQEALVSESCREISILTAGRKSILVFAAGVNHGMHVCEALNQAGVAAEYLDGNTTDLERATLINRFKAGELRCLVNINVLTTGFDATRVDAVVVLRATCSPGLFYQMAGRGFRLHADKEDCLVLDYGGNVERHGPLDAPDYGEKSTQGSKTGEAPTKVCPGCNQEVPAATRECSCGFIFEIIPQPRHDAKANQEAVILGATVAPEWRTVISVDWAVHIKRGSDSRTLRVDYSTEESDWPISEWVCLEHEGYAKNKAMNWWLQRCSKLPADIDDALTCKRRGMIADTRRICVAPDPKNPRFMRITEYDLDRIPDESEWIELKESWEPEPF